MGNAVPAREVCVRVVCVRVCVCGVCACVLCVCVCVCVCVFGAQSLAKPCTNTPKAMTQLLVRVRGGCSACVPTSLS